VLTGGFSRLMFQCYCSLAHCPSPSSTLLLLYHCSHGALSGLGSGWATGRSEAAAAVVAGARAGVQATRRPCSCGVVQKHRACV
jgi:hypothetical protein